MSYLYQPMGDGPSFREIVAQVEAGTSPEDIKRRLAALDKAKRAGALRILIGPFRTKGLPAGFWRTLKRDKPKAWATKLLHKNALMKVAQRAGLLPLKVVTVPASGANPKQRFALYGKWENPVYGTGTVKVGIFAWQDTDVFKKKKNEYKIPWSKGERDFFQKSMEIGRKTAPIMTVGGAWITSFGEKEHKRVVHAYPEKERLKITSGPPSDRIGWADVALWSTFPVVKMNDEIFKITAPLIDVFGEILGALLDIVAVPFFGAMQPMTSPEMSYKKPNYLLWGGVAVGVIGLAYLYKRRSP
jgi:hypothetical protein